MLPMSSSPIGTPNVRAPWFVALLLIMPVYSTGCSSTPEATETASQDLYSSDEQIFVGDSIEMSYDPNVIMKRAESFFEKESYAEAVVEYKHFLDLHQNHTLAPYAQYKIGVSHYKQFRTVDRDPMPLQKSVSGFEKLLKVYPASRYETEARETILTCKELLVQRHLMVGEFYYNRGSYLAAAHRYEKIVNEFPEIETTGQAMFQLAKTYQDLGIEEWTQEWLVTLMKQYPNSDYYSSAESLLADLHEEHPTLLASLPSDFFTPEQTDSTTSMDVALSPQPKSGPIFTNAGILPVTSVLHDQISTVLSEKTPSQTPCAIGSWCDDETAQPTTPSVTTSPSTTACNTGDWC